MRGDFQHRLVAHDAAARQVALLRRGLAPRRQGTQHAEKPPVGAAAQPEAAPRLGRLAAVDRRVDQIGHLLGEPAGAAVFRQHVLQPVIDRPQMDDIGERVVDLSFGQGPMRPVGKARGFVQGRAGQPLDQCLVADRVAEAAHHRGHLGVEDGVRHIAGQMKEDLEILARRVEHLEGRRVGHQRQQRRQIDPFGQRVDRHRFLRAGHLHDAEDRPIGALAHELGIDGSELRAFLPDAEGGKRVGVGDQLHRGGL